MNRYDYRYEDYAVNLPTEVYISGFRDTRRFLEYCKQCKNYGAVWACPPFEHDTTEELKKYSNVIIIATKIIPEIKNLPFSEANHLLRPERLRIERKLRDMEKENEGKSFAFAGDCLYCPDGKCQRMEGRACLHPDLVRPSLEAYGFDLEKTASELFGFPILWSRNQSIPEYLTLISGFFHNSGNLIFK